MSHKRFCDLRRKRFFSLTIIVLIFVFTLSSCAGLEELAQEISEVNSAPSVQVDEVEEVVLPPIEPILTLDTGVWKFIEGYEAVAAIENSTEDLSWVDERYDDTAWARGVGSFGAKDGLQGELSGGYYPSTLLAQHNSSNDNYPVYLLRSEFTIMDIDHIGTLLANIVYDDAVIVYLNGNVVFEGNVPQGGYLTASSYGAANTTGEPISAQFEIPARNMELGINVLAVELRQADEYSSDVYFEFTSLVPTYNEIQSTNVSVGSDETSATLTFAVGGAPYPNAQVEVIDATSPGAEPMIYDVSGYEEGEFGFSYRTEMTNLEPNKQYTYKIDINNMEKTGMFETGSVDDGVSVLMMGDPQFNGDELDLSGQKSTLLDNIITYGGDADMMTVVGDVSMNASDFAAYKSAFATFAESHKLNSIVFGSKDMNETLLSDGFSAPNVVTSEVISDSGSMSNNYYYSYGDVLFIVLNSNHADVQHASYIDNTVANYKATVGEPSFIVLYLNHSLYSQGNNGIFTDAEYLDLLRLELAPTISANNIDIVVSANEHMYTRSYLMNGQTVSAYPGGSDTVQKTDGETLYISLGTASTEEYFDENPVAQSHTAFSFNGYTPMMSRMDFSDNTAKITTWTTLNGEVIDEFTLTK